MRRTPVLASLAVLLTALALVPAGAHLFALPNKLAMPADTYLAAQRAYDGWALLGVLPMAAILANLGAALALRRRGRPAGLTWLAALLLLAGLAVFFTWTFPANRRPRIGRGCPLIGRRCGRPGNGPTPPMRC
jgi:hypothetical protein